MEHSEHMARIKVTVEKMQESLAEMQAIMDEMDGGEVNEKEYMGMDKEKRYEHDKKQILGKTEDGK